ncbi:hypothetical protein [Streptomyces sp. 378]|uniref:hypothetical protein n=1 Tax=Streptomyces sp. 378 TaxID=3049412 RepID=UPI0024C2313A|nr:hypothetical protein [Streptomyces sp. 378]
MSIERFTALGAGLMPVCGFSPRGLGPLPGAHFGTLRAAPLPGARFGPLLGAALAALASADPGSSGRCALGARRPRLGVLRGLGLRAHSVLQS